MCLALEAGLDAWECLKEGLTGSEKIEEEIGGIRTATQSDCSLSLSASSRVLMPV